MSLKRLFSRKTRSSQKTYEKVIENQDKITGKLAFLVNDNLNLQEKVTSANNRFDQFFDRVDAVLLVSGDANRLVDNLKSQLHESRKANYDLTHELKETVNSKHKIELGSCKFETELKDAQKEVLSLHQQVKYLQDLLSEKHGELKDAQEEKNKLRSEISHLENTVSDLTTHVLQLKANLFGEQNFSRLQKQNCVELEEEVKKLRNEMFDLESSCNGQVKDVWIKFHEMKQHRDHLLYQALQGTCIERKPNEILTINNDHYRDVYHETQVMKLEMILYRRQKLIELLTERLGTHEPGFSIQNDAEMKVYLDSQANEMLLDSAHTEEEMESKSVVSVISHSELLAGSESDTDTNILLKLTYN